MSYTCDNQDQNAAVILITDLSDGSVLALCGGCVPGYIDAMWHTFADAGMYDPPAVSTDAPPADDPGGDGTTDPDDVPPTSTAEGQAMPGDGDEGPADSEVVSEPGADSPAAAVTSQDAAPF